MEAMDKEAYEIKGSYFLLIFQQGVRTLTIIPVADILEIRPNNKQRIIKIRTKNNDNICYYDVSRFKIALLNI